MKKIIVRALLTALALLLALPLAYAQDTATLPPLPRAYKLQNVRFEAQGWNNCGPATLTNALTYFGYTDNQRRAANWLKPNTEDKNVSPDQMVEFVNTQVPEINVFAKTRYNGTLELMKRLLVNNFPVIIEKGYDPEPERLGWMGHYLLLVGYDDGFGVFITHDSYIGADINYEYEYIDRMWKDFNYTYIVLYPAQRAAELDAILGTDADPWQNAVNALERARNQAIEDQTDAFAWFNMGTSFVALQMYEEAAIAYDQARSYGLPWRMLWYQFGPFEAYYHAGRYDDMIVLAQANLNDGGGHFVEETYYYGGLAREGKGEYQRAISNYQAALQFNPNFMPAREALNRAQQLAQGN